MIGLRILNMKQVILIHGALGNAKEFESIAPLLKERFDVLSYEIPGHGKRIDEINKFNLEEIINDFKTFLDKVGPSFIFGFSLGGYLAISTALEDSKNIKGIITLGTKLNWSPEIAKKEVATLSVEFLQEKAPPFYDYLVNIHDKSLPTLLDATKSFMTELGNRPILSEESVKDLDLPIHLIRGGKDRMVTKEETEIIVSSLKNGRYFEIPSFPHPLGFLYPKHVAQLIAVQLQSFAYNYLKTENFGEISYQSIIKNDSDEQPALLFLHEALGSIAQWKKFPENLCSALNLNGYVIELNGYGFSSENPNPRDEYYLHKMAWEHLPEIIEQLPHNGKYILIGHSDGGTNALLYASKHGAQIDGIVTMAAHVINEKETVEGIEPAVGAYEAGKLKGLECYHFEKTRKLFFDWADTWKTKAFKTWDIQRDISSVSVPVLAIQGDKDQYGTEKQLALIQQNCRGPVQTAIISDCGHSPHLEKEIDVLTHIVEWKKNL